MVFANGPHSEPYTPSKPDVRKLFAGYETVIGRLDTRNYGIVQNWSRVLLIGPGNDLARAPKFPETAPNTGDALVDLMAANDCRRPSAAATPNGIVISSLGDCRLGFAASQKEKTMRMLLIMAAAIGLSAPMAFAECAYHAKNNAAVDKKMTTASVATDNQTTSDDLVLLKKTDRVTEEEKPAE
ncbi:hypothetical protein FHT86_006290 [Rhizobium sp. BK313]|uniref:hypothetical protein n=1 Tax=Rhizobium sp. BK313 TaxID=2587081 RepID=UPI0010D573DE|nr:hypothetical protein [Rhizobium sp. BK313]MBB3457965.1 hypothetical protein [Rhizobium sp. BK313]